MFKKLKINRKINSIRKKIENVEKLRSRSQAALVQAILSHTEPTDEDTEYFNNYTKQINDLRNEMHELQIQLKHLS